MKQTPTIGQLVAVQEGDKIRPAKVTCVEKSMIYFSYIEANGSLVPGGRRSKSRLLGVDLESMRCSVGLSPEWQKALEPEKKP